VLILTPQLIELELSLTELERHGVAVVQQNVGRLQCWNVPGLQLLLAVGGHGKTQFAIQAQYLLDRLLQTDVLICIGGAGALDQRLCVGDIVVGTSTVEHDYRIRFVPATLPEHAGDPLRLEALRALSAQQDFGGKVCFGPIASGDEDIIDPSRAAKLQHETSALCVAWEGSGGARAARFNEIPFIEIRGITDTASSTACADYHQNLKIVMPRIMSLLVEWRRRVISLR
jgi:adenosylhomocysteine nucleosidase